MFNRRGQIAQPARGEAETEVGIVIDRIPGHQLGEIRRSLRVLMGIELRPSQHFAGAAGIGSAATVWERTCTAAAASPLLSSSRPRTYQS